MLKKLAATGIVTAAAAGAMMVTTPALADDLDDHNTTGVGHLLGVGLLPISIKCNNIALLAAGHQTACIVVKKGDEPRGYPKYSSTSPSGGSGYGGQPGRSVRNADGRSAPRSAGAPDRRSVPVPRHFTFAPTNRTRDVTFRLPSDDFSRQSLANTRSWR
jgi:hypothetical protein